jgi:hypothetical protein
MRTEGNALSCALLLRGVAGQLQTTHGIDQL